MTIFFLTQGKGVTMVFDCTGAGLANVDFDFARYMLDHFQQYYPSGSLKHLVAHEMPWILSTACKLLMSWMPADLRALIKFTTKETITELIAVDNLPYCLGGRSKRNYLQVPEGCRSAVVHYRELGLSEKEIRAIEKKYKPMVDEALQEAEDLRQWIES